MDTATAVVSGLLAALLVSTAVAVGELGVAATAGLVLVALWAIATHVRAGDPPAAAVPAAFALLMAAGALGLQLTTA